MLSNFFAPNVNIPPGGEFKLLSPPHWIYIGGWALITVALCLAMRGRSENSKNAAFRFVLLTYLLSEAGRIVWGVYHGLFMWQDWIPIHLCATLVFIGPFIAFTKNGKVKELLVTFVYGVSMPAALFALLTPDKPVATPFCFEFFQTMYSHGAIICIGVYFVAVMGFRPRAKNLPALFAMTLSWALVCFGANQAINRFDPREIPWSANYMFLTFAPRDTPLEFFESVLGRFYLLPTLFILAAFWLLLFAPWELARRKKRRSLK